MFKESLSGSFEDTVAAERERHLKSPCSASVAAENTQESQGAVKP